MKSQANSALLLITALFCAGCANPGPPKPPSLRLPQFVKDLSAERVGDHVVLRWTTPSRTTDDIEIKGAMTAEICREMDAKPPALAARGTTCLPIRRLPVVAGPSEVMDMLPAALQVEPVMLLTYRIRVFNATGHSAGDSTLAAYAAAGQAPAAVTALHATASERGAILEWHRATAQEGDAVDTVDLERIDLSTPPPGEKKARQSGISSPGKNHSVQTRKSDQEAPSEAHLRAQDAVAGRNADAAGTVDGTAAMGDTYTYSARRSREVSAGNHTLEIQSEASAPITLVMRDTFPPKSPSGLVAISGNLPLATHAPAGPYIDLSWEPNGETDLAGYRVYRQLVRPDGSPQGPLARLTALPINVPAYRDVAVKGGQGYIYSVTAVDADGNESAPSAKALEVLSPDSGGPPN